MSVNHSGFNAAVAQHFLNCADVIIGLQQVAGVAVPQGVGGSPFGNLRLAYGFFDSFLGMSLVQMIASELFCFGNIG